MRKPTTAHAMFCVKEKKKIEGKKGIERRRTELT